MKLTCKIGSIDFQTLIWILGAATTTVAWSYSTFMTRSEIVPIREMQNAEITTIRDSQIRIENDIKDILRTIKR